MILKSADAEKEIALVKPVEADDTGPISFAYLRLTDEDFERLSYALAKLSAPINIVRTRGDTTLMVRGADAGRDVLLTSQGTPVGVIQCKRLESGMSLPAVFREIAKLILFAKVNGDLSFQHELLYPHSGPRSCLNCCRVFCAPAATGSRKGKRYSGRGARSSRNICDACGPRSG